MSGVRWISSTYARWHGWVSSLSVYQKKEKCLLSFFSVVATIMLIAGSYDYYILQLSREYAVLLPSFIPNDEAILSSVRDRNSRAICASYPEDPWIRFIDDKRIIVAVPHGNQEEDRNFSFTVGTCERDRG
jgi:hypothetical protein